MLSEEQWSDLEPLIEVCRPHAKVPSQHLRRTVEAILWRFQNGATWRSLPAEFGPWWMAAQTFIRLARLGVWKKLLALVRERGVRLGMVFLDGTNVRAHQKAADASRKEDLHSTQRLKQAVRRFSGLLDLALMLGNKPPASDRRSRSGPFRACVSARPSRYPHAAHDA